MSFRRTPLVVRKNLIENLEFLIIVYNFAETVPLKEMIYNKINQINLF